MPTLTDLKNKWFLPMTGNNPDGVPQRRHSADAGPNTLSVSTDGNLVTPLIDGETYMQRWRDRLVALGGSGEFMHGGWRFEEVKPDGETAATKNALEEVRDSNSAGSDTWVLICRNLLMQPFNRPTTSWLRGAGVSTTCMDARFPAGGSNHQKFALHKDVAAASAQLGSIDLSFSRWDTPVHAPANPDWHPTHGKQTHDTGAFVEGPAVGDIERCFRERWNDTTRSTGMQPLLPRQPLITSPIAAPASVGPHSVQVLRTYGITNRLFGYSWHATGEFTVWASYLNAIKRASTYIYIEDQYFLPFDWPPCFSRTGAARDTDIVFQLGEAMRRGVHVIVLTPSNDEDATHMFQKYQRDVGVNFLNAVRAGGSPGEVVVSSLQNGGTDVYVHSKLMIVDDEFVLIGSTNVGQRSMTHDGELHIGVVDDNDLFAKDLRKTLWAEHTGRPAGTLDPFPTAFTHWKADTAASGGHLRPYPVDPLSVFPAVAGSNAPPLTHSTTMRTVVDPYAGPAGIR
ncbi:MAG TPA: phospholipase D-like domain-containing protein [Roseovarius sp.]